MHISSVEMLLALQRAHMRCKLALLEPAIGELGHMRYKLALLWPATAADAFVFR